MSREQVINTIEVYKNAYGDTEKAIMAAHSDIMCQFSRQMDEISATFDGLADDGVIDPEINDLLHEFSF